MFGRGSAARMPHCALLTQKFCEIKDKSGEECPACQGMGKGSRAELSDWFGSGTGRNAVLSEVN